MRHVEIAPTIPDIIPVVHSKNQIGHKVMPKVLADSKARVFTLLIKIFGCERDF